MAGALLVQVFAAFRTFDDAINTYETLAGIADGLRKGNDCGWVEGTDISKYLWNPTTPLQKKASKEPSDWEILRSCSNASPAKGWSRRSTIIQPA